MSGRQAIESGQLARLRVLLRALVPANCFQTTKLRAAGCTEEIAGLAEFCERVPFTCKQELVADQAARPPYGTNLTFPPEEYTRFSQTSGTTGRPLRWLDTPESWSAMLDNWDRVLAAADVRRGDPIFCAFSFGPFLGFWTAFEAAARRGCLCLPGGGMSSLARLRTMIDNGVTAVCCTPTYAIRLAEVAHEEGIDLGKSAVRKLIVAGEPGGSVKTTRSRIEQLWPGAQVHDHHGMSETGPVSYECPAQPGRLHVMEAAFIAEVVDPDTGQAVGNGEAGELVLTTLTRTGSPLLRYRTGDFVRPAPVAQCACGSWELALEGGILSRTDEMIVVRGVNIYPTALDAVVRGCEAIGEYRAEVSEERGMYEIALQAEPAPGCEEAAGTLAHQLETVLRAAFDLRIPVRIVPLGSLPRFEMKAKRWVCL